MISIPPFWATPSTVCTVLVTRALLGVQCAVRALHSGWLLLSETVLILLGTLCYSWILLQSTILAFLYHTASPLFMVLRSLLLSRGIRPLWTPHPPSSVAASGGGGGGGRDSMIVILWARLILWVLGRAAPSTPPLGHLL